MIFFKYNNRGILIPVFVIIPFIGVLMLKVELARKFGGSFDTEYCSQIFIGFGLIISSIWTYLTSFDYINVKIKKEYLELNHHFFFISNRMWSFIFFGIGMLVILGGILEFLFN
ncbi:hypothetical protein [Flavobacterium urocaniciphilum]|uniref:Uncharacterized protein n=1 Tax=Flavobacterium urocaniciphilum TaxID=1299341 RepID=A0A1H8ZDY1_9FLAO|nr:hypothetical protein [Flavobacterium urocaniciphilum]SEP62629.1 hypothetical protein SAMN05444005_101657 [Flavobacterium urocaniciphilum]